MHLDVTRRPGTPAWPRLISRSRACSALVLQQRGGKAPASRCKSSKSLVDANLLTTHATAARVSPEGTLARTASPLAAAGVVARGDAQLECWNAFARGPAAATTKCIRLTHWARIHLTRSGAGQAAATISLGAGSEGSQACLRAVLAAARWCSLSGVRRKVVLLPATPTREGVHVHAAQADAPQILCQDRSIKYTRWSQVFQRAADASACNGSSGSARPQESHGAVALARRKGVRASVRVHVTQ